jgi:osmoprotectant transport system ATP-binding protein
MAEAGVEFAKVSYALPAAERGQAGRTLLHEVSLRLQPGTTTALLGRSGSGKTTLLRMVNGLVRPTTGRVVVGGTEVGSLDEPGLIGLRRRIGYVIQETGLFPHMTVERNAWMALELAGPPKDTSRSLQDDNKKKDNTESTRRRVEEVLALVGLDAGEFRGRYPWQLSGGQRQRVGLARALASDPNVLLMDEPFGALDPMTRAEMQTMLRGLLERMGKTVLLVTHDLDEALYLAGGQGGRVVFLEAGEVVADLRADEVMGSQNHHVQAYVKAVRRS